MKNQTTRKGRTMPASNQSRPVQQNRTNNFFNFSSDNKPMIIGGIAVAAVLILAVFLFVSKPFAGQAIGVAPLAKNTAGIGQLSEVITVGDTFTVPIKANLGNSEALTVSFLLTYDSDLLAPNCAADFIKYLNKEFLSKK